MTAPQLFLMGGQWLAGMVLLCRYADTWKDRAIIGLCYLIIATNGYGLGYSFPFQP